MAAKSRQTFRVVRTLQAIKPPASGREEYWDEVVKGLGLRVSASGRKTWVLMYRVRADKRLRRASLGTYPKLSLSDARELAQADLREAALGKDPAAERKAYRRAETFGEMAEQYLEKHAKVHKLSWQTDKRIINKDLLPRFRSRKAASIKRSEIRQMLEEIRDRGAPIRANRTLEIVRKMFNWAIDEEILTENPCVRVKKIAQERKRERVLAEDEIRRIWAALAGLDTFVAAQYKMRFLTGQRGGEILAMSWGDIELDQAMWQLPANLTKTKQKPQRTPLSNPALYLLNNLGHRGDPVSAWVFPSPVGQSHLTNLWRALDEVRERADVNFWPHDIRRTVATMMTRDLGISRDTVKRVLQHIDYNVTDHYIIFEYDREKRTALNTWARRLMQILTDDSDFDREGAKLKPYADAMYIDTDPVKLTADYVHQAPLWAYFLDPTHPKVGKSDGVNARVA